MTTNRDALNPRLIPSIVRQKRHSYPSQGGGTVEVFIGDTPVELINISESGVAFRSAKRSLESEHTKEVSLVFFKNQTLKIEGRVVWSREEAGQYIYGFEFTKGYLPEGFLQAFDHIHQLKERMGKRHAMHLTVSQDFRLLTYEIHHFLKTTKESLDSLEEQIMVVSESERAAHREVVISQIEPDFVARVREYSKQLDTIYAPIFDKGERKIYADFFRDLVGAFYTSNPFIGRALVKPRGYAGDFEMMNQIYRDKFEGKTLFQMLMHRYGISESSSQSVKYRKGYLIEQILNESKGKEKFVVGSVACGPAREVVDLLASISVEESAKFTFVLMDQDIEALVNANRNIKETIVRRGLLCEAHFVPLSVKSILEGASEADILQQFNFNMIYSAGLYDYLYQPVAQVLTRILCQCVNNGLIIIGNFHPSNPTKTISELVADWRLIHRTEAEMMDLIPESSVKSKQLHKDSLGIDLFLEIRT